MGDLIEMVDVARCKDCGLVRRIEELEDGVCIEDCDTGGGLSYRQIARILHIPVATVMHIERQALRKLRLRPGNLKDWRSA